MENKRREKVNEGLSQTTAERDLSRRSKKDNSQSNLDLTAEKGRGGERENKKKTRGKISGPS